MKIKAFFKNNLLFIIIHPLRTTLTLAFLAGLIISIAGAIRIGADMFIVGGILGIFLVFPPMLTLYNLFYLVFPKPSENIKKAGLVCEYFTVISGALCTMLWMMLREEVIRWGADWSKQLYNNELHTPVATNTVVTLIAIALISLVGYLILRIFGTNKLSPLIATISIAALYLGVALYVVWMIQIAKHDVVLCIYPLNIILIFAKTVRDVVLSHRNEVMSDRFDESVRFYKIRKLLNNSYSWTYIGFLLAIPMLGLIVAFLTLFGQSPDSIIKAWTETADWTLSQKIAPENLPYDYHYLCTVAAGGHRKIVKPLRTGTRHGHTILVNRQLLVANAFEELISEKIPKIHRFIRKVYDKYGYPIAKHIRSPYAADAVWFLMKPLEWSFLIVLYLFDTKPENRIAVQYPHKPLPMKIDPGEK